MKAERTAITSHRSLVTLLLVLACAGCSTLKTLGDGAQAGYFDNYLRYEHPFTDVAADAARRDAERECASRKKVVVKLSGTCTLTRCITYYQCADKQEATGYQK